MKKTIKILHQNDLHHNKGGKGLLIILAGGLTSMSKCFIYLFLLLYYIFLLSWECILKMYPFQMYCLGCKHDWGVIMEYKEQMQFPVFKSQGMLSLTVIAIEYIQFTKK